MMVSAEEKRWIVVGIAMQVAVPVLRNCIKQGMDKHYTNLDAYCSHLITPCTLKTLTHHQVNADPTLKNIKFQNVNNNFHVHGKNKSLYTYNINSSVDLAKLYLPDYLAQFSAFDDSLDMTAILRLLGFNYMPAVIFSPLTQTSADDVRESVRNKWGHFDISEWSEAFFNDCFDKLETLERSLGLTAGVEKSTLDQLNDWKTKGVYPGHHPGTDEVYNMTALPRGKALIINNKLFAGHPEHDNQSTRHGSEEDVRKVKALFNSLGFDVHTKENLTRLQLLNELDSVACQDHSGYDCFVLWLMSHGKSGEVFCSDGVRLPIQSAHDMLSDCKTLRGKPKLFFIQACRGGENDEGFAIVTDSPSPLQDPRGHVDLPSDPSASRIIPTHADFLYSFATVDGHVAYRCPDQGSYYVRTLVDVFHEHATHDDLLGILTTVNRRVSEMVMTMPALGSENDVKNFKQMPEVRHTLRKRLLF